MNTIHSNLPPYDAALSQSSLGRPLRNLAEHARPSAQQPEDGGLADARAQAAGVPDARAAVELQNRYSALADPAEAAAANAAASSTIHSDPGAAVAAHSLVDAGAVNQLLSES